MSVLYIIATPIGNLEDISIRAIRVLKEVDFILCEDTRVTKKLLDHYNIKTKIISYHHHSNLKKTEYIIDLLKQEKNLALVSDAGTPGISDPGNKLIEIIEKKTEIGEWVMPGTTVAVIARIDVVDVIADVPATILPFIHPGMEVEVSVAGA